jgi:hypothetical protein
MDSKKPNRRGFLKGGAAIAGVAAGAAQSARGQAPAIAAYSKKELIGYGERSHFVTSLREPAPGRPSPDAFGLVFHVATPLQIRPGLSRPVRCTIRLRTGARSSPILIPKSIA